LCCVLLAASTCSFCCFDLFVLPRLPAHLRSVEDINAIHRPIRIQYHAAQAKQFGPQTHSHPLPLTSTATHIHCHSHPHPPT
jgi:hypothetical protein